MEQKIEDKKTVTINRTYAILGIVMIIFSLSTSLLAPFLSAKETEKVVLNHEGRIIKLEDSEKSSRELLLEIKFNLKNLVEKTGGTYFESNPKQ